MERTLRDREILNEIRDLSSKRATGKLQITTGMTQGAIFFDKGQIVDANLGKLNGFQAINAIASIPECTFNFDPSISPPVQNLNFSERLVLTEVFGLKVQREPKPSPTVNEPSDAAPTPAILLNDVEDQPNNSMLDAQPTAQFEIEQALELSSPEYLPAVNEPSDAAPTPAILLNDVEDQPNSSVLDAQPTVRFEVEQVLELSAVDPAAVTSIATRLNTDEQLLSTHYSNQEDSIPDNADEVEVINGITHRNDYVPIIFYEPGSARRFRPTLVAAVLGVLLGAVTAALLYRSRELSLPRAAVVQTSSAASVPATQTPGLSSEVVSGAPDLTGKGAKVPEHGQRLTRARRTLIAAKRSMLQPKLPLVFRAAPRPEKVAATFSPPSPSLRSVDTQSATHWREPLPRPPAAPAVDPQPRSDSNVLKRGARNSIRGVRFVSSRVSSWVGSVFGKKKRSAQ